MRSCPEVLWVMTLAFTYDFGLDNILGKCLALCRIPRPEPNIKIRLKIFLRSPQTMRAKGTVRGGGVEGPMAPEHVSQCKG